jgi:ElaA protein
VDWRLRSFDALRLDELYALMALRQQVFVVEQRCAYLDADGLDAAAAHLFCVAPSPSLAPQSPPSPPLMLAYARLFAPGVRHEAASIGRVVTAPAVRRTGLGRELMTRAIGALAELYGPTAIRIGAQRHLERFYASFGFVRDGEDYLEDGIPHLPMRR